MFRVLKTDGGAHPPEKWALFTAEDVFDTSKMTEAGPWASRLMEARQVQLKVAMALTKHHAAVQEAEKAALSGDEADEHLAGPHDVSPHMDDAMAAVLDAIKGSSWESHYAKPDVQAEVSKVLTHHFATAMHIERLWHADRNPNHKAAQAYASMWRA